MKKLVNLTPHDCTIYDGESIMAKIPPSGNLARCCQEIHDLPMDCSFEFGSPRCGVKTLGEIQGLPDPEEDTIFFVSLAVAQKAWQQGRTDVVCPLDAHRKDGMTDGTIGLAWNPSIYKGWKYLY